MDVCVGEQPKPIGSGAVMAFNKVFQKMFEYFGSHERIVTVHFENHEEDPLTCFGSLTVSCVRRWLEYCQLITVQVQKQALDQASQVEGFRKNRTLRIMKPTKRGFEAYENGQIITIQQGSSYYQKERKLGIGKPYTFWDKIEEIAEAIWVKHKIAMSRRAKWHPELKKFHLNNLLDKKTDEALNMLQAWASAKAFDWNINHKRNRRVKIFTRVPEGVEISLPTGQQRLFG